MRDDRVNIERIIRYCDDIRDDRERFGDDQETYFEDESYQRSTDMSLMQIGETVNKLSDELLDRYNEITWDAVIGFRNVIAHRYEWMDRNRIWMIIKEDVPELKRYCERIIADIS